MPHKFHIYLIVINFCDSHSTYLPLSHALTFHGIIALAVNLSNFDVPLVVDDQARYGAVGDVTVDGIPGPDHGKQPNGVLTHAGIHWQVHCKKTIQASV